MSAESQPSLPDDVLGRLQNIVMACFDVQADQTVPIRVELLHDAVAEIERLREERDVAEHTAGRWRTEALQTRMATDPPKPERWEVFARRMKTEATELEDAEPFGVTDHSLVWFRRRVPA